MTPNEIILDFLAKQPDTIRSNLYCRVVLPFISRVHPDDNYAEMAVDIVNPADDDDKVYRAAMVIGLLDFAFTQQRDESAKDLEALADKHEDDHLKRIALGIPLREKHRDRARAEWWGLREGALSYDALWDFYSEVSRKFMQSMKPRL